MEVVRLEGVSKTYKNAEVPALEVSDLTVKEGEYISIRGVSGSGKSTLLHILGGLLKPTTGKVLFRGRDIYSMKDTERSEWRGKQVGYLFQNIQMVQALTVLENMILARKFGNDKTADVGKILDILGLNEIADHLPGQLSGGQKRRAMIGCVLIRRPQILLADEPTNDLDAYWAGRVIDCMRGQVQDRGVLILVTHDRKWADTAVTRYTMSSGKLTRDT